MSDLNDMNESSLDDTTVTETDVTETERDLSATDTDTVSVTSAKNRKKKKSSKNTKARKKVSELTPEQAAKRKEQNKEARNRHREKHREKKRLAREEREKENLSNLEKKVQVEDNLNDLLEIGNGMYKQLKDIIKADGERFANMPDKNKLQFFREELKYEEFMKEFPVTTRYLICMGQYSTKAFKRFLNRVRLAKHPEPGLRPKGYMEDQWIRRQADYVRYLWEAYQKHHWNNEEAKMVWSESYKQLRGEFDDFRDKYKDIEKSTKIEKKKHNAEVAKEILQRYASGDQTPETDEEKQELLRMLKDRVYKHRFDQGMKELLTKVKEIKHTASGRGTNTEDPDKPTIKMIEHIDEKRMNEVPEHMKLTKEEEAKLPTINE